MWDCKKGEQSLFIYFCFNHQIVVAQLLGLAGDNTSNNQTMTECLADLIPSWGGEMSHVHCIAHIVNLVEQVFV